jgi:hypothetical protein
MVLTLGNGQAFDTETDLTAQERHVLQKLFLWKSMASSVEEFRKKKQEALDKGWNQSGPIRESDALRAIVVDLEKKVVLRLQQEKGSG